MAEKRNQKRFIKRLNVDFTVDGITRTGVSSNFSINGLFIRTNHPYVADTVLDIVLYLPDGRKIKLKGKVARASKTDLGRIMGIPSNKMKNGMGIELIEKDVEYLKLIRDLVG